MTKTKSTGSALASIKAIDNEVHAAGYLRYHMDEYKIVGNSWVKKFIPGAIGTTVPERNPFFTKGFQSQPRNSSKIPQGTREPWIWLEFH